MKKPVFRRSILTKKYFNKTDLFRLVKLSSGEIIFDKEMKLQGRSIHFEAIKDICDEVLSIKKLGMINHFLKSSITNEEIILLHEESMKSFE